MQLCWGGPTQTSASTASATPVPVCCCCWFLQLSPQVKAVVLRINSPGGSAVASDMIAREVQLLREAGKPVVACMGDVAASGGYYIAGALVLLSCAQSPAVMQQPVLPRRQELAPAAQGLGMLRPATGAAVAGRVSNPLPVRKG